MSNKQIIGIIGVVFLIAGIFLPLVKVSIIGNLNFYEKNQTESIIIIALAVLSLIFILVKRYILLWFSSIAIIVVMATASIRLVRIAKSLMKAQSAAEKIMGEKLVAKITEKITETAIKHTQVKIGIAFLVIGLLLIILCAILGKREKVVPETPQP